MTIYDNPLKPFYVFDLGPEDAEGFDSLNEAMAKAEGWAEQHGWPVYVFETKGSFNHEAEED